MDCSNDICDIILTYLADNNINDWIPSETRDYCWHYKDTGYVIDAGTRWTDFYYNGFNESDEDYQLWVTDKDWYNKLVSFLNDPQKFITYIHNKDIEDALEKLD